VELHEALRNTGEAGRPSDADALDASSFSAEHSRSLIA